MSSGEDEEVGELDQIDTFHVQREKATLEDYGSSEEQSSSDDEGSIEEEVMTLDLLSSEADLSSSDQVGDGREPVTLKSWGRKVVTYYEEEEEEEESLDGELEEREALHLQSQHAAILSQDDFDAQFSDIDQSPLKIDMVVPSDLALMDASKKHLLLGRDHPELPHILASLKRAFGSAVKGTTLPDSYSSSSHRTTLWKTKVLINLSYSLNSMYYLLLKAGRVDVTSHPVTSTLLLLHKLLGKLEIVDKVVERQGSLSDSKSQPSGPLSTGNVANDERKEHPLSFYHRIATQKISEREKGSWLKTALLENVEPLEGKRAITYQISRNKGLGVSGKRQLRNPRVKHRLKYRQALLRRKSQVQPVTHEMRKYAGEVTGIKTNLSRSTLIAS